MLILSENVFDRLTSRGQGRSDIRYARCSVRILIPIVGISDFEFILHDVKF